MTFALGLDGLTHLFDQRPHVLSGGEKRRLAIASILAMESKFWCLTSPFRTWIYPGVKQVMEQILAASKRPYHWLTTPDLDRVIAPAAIWSSWKRQGVARIGPVHELISELEAFRVRARADAPWRRREHHARERAALPIRIVYFHRMDVRFKLLGLALLSMAGLPGGAGGAGGSERPWFWRFCSSSVYPFGIWPENFVILRFCWPLYGRPRL